MNLNRQDDRGGHPHNPNPGVQPDRFDPKDELRGCEVQGADTVMASVRRTHRVVVVDEGWKTGSLAAEITARIVEQAFYDLDAPIARVCSQEAPMPYAKHLEEAALPQPAKIVSAVTAMLGKG